MAHFKAPLTAVIVLLAVTSAKDQSRWSRQISSYTADISDWVPLSGPVEREPPLPPIKRQAVAEPRILSEPFPGLSRPTGFDSFPSRTYYNSPSNRQLYLQSVPSVPSAPQNYLSEQGFGQNIRFGLQQPNFPLSQGFLTSQFGYDGVPKPRPIQSAPVKYESFKSNLPAPVKTFNQPQAPILKPFSNQAKKPDAPKFVDGYRAENTSNEYYKKKPLQQKIKFESFDKPKTEQHSSPKVEREEVQLLYVPVESLNRGQFNIRSPVPNTPTMNADPFYQGAQKPVVDQRPIDNYAAQNYYSDYSKGIDQIPKFSTLSSPFPTSLPTTPKPKKLKPHQPPLAIFLTEEASRNNQVKVGDVLNSLKHATSVPVLDSVNPLNAPKVFIGPSSLQPLDKYVKFELPYLSNIDNSDKKIRQLPFFVAPLSYNTPQGFAKIPFPSPHVGSVVINSQIREVATQRPSTENLQQNYYRQELQPVTQKPTISYYSTAAPQKANIQPNYQSNYYSFEPQTVSTFKPIEPETKKPGNYFIENSAPQYTFASQNNYPVPEPAKYTPRKETTTQTTLSTTNKPPSTYPSQLLETHNPYSINQAFHFSTPLDYHTYFEEFKEPAVTPKTEEPVLEPKPTLIEKVSEKTYKQQAPNYVQNYSPEIHYPEVQSPRYPTYNANEYNTKTENVQPYSPVQDNIAEVNPPQYTETKDAQVPVANENNTEGEKISTVYEGDTQKYEYNQYETNFDEESKTSTSTSTTTTRRPIRQRTRTRYTTTTTPRSDSGEYSTKAVTRRPLRERKPLPTRKYEPNKIITEKPTRKPIDYNNGESTTKSTRTRTRGRIQFRPSEGDEPEKKNTNSKKDQDLAYQRDVLHQNYPVTIQERMSTVDIEAITEPSPKISTKNIEYVTENYDTENAYTYEKIHSVSPFSSSSESNEDIPISPTKTTVAQTETDNVPSLSTPEEEFYSSKSSVAPPQSYEEVTVKEEEHFVKQTTQQKEEPVYATEFVTISEQNSPSYSLNEYARDVTTTQEPEVITVGSQEEEEENIVQTTPSYNRVRVRPGVIKQYHQSSTESTKVKIDRRRPVTYRPAFDKRRTTMRIDEIEADLKTKQVRGRQENEYKHPVYKPEPSTEATSTQEGTTKRGQFRRRRPSYSYTTSTTESSEKTVTSRAKYEVKNRFRGRRPTTEKATEKSDVQAETATTTKPLQARYSHRPRLSERYNKKPQQEETEDQDSNYSINRPKYAEPESDIWSDAAFKPYNPNNIVDDQKFPTTERRSDREELDIITARNEFEDVLISVTPATNNRNEKKIPDIPPTLEALVEQSKVTKSDSNDNMSTFESMLEEVMKSLEEQDENEYSSSVMKHKGGEIGEIPPERIITSAEAYTKTTPIQHETTMAVPATEDAIQANEEVPHSAHRRGFWKKVKVRPVAAESIEAAESQYYHSTVNRFGQPLKQPHEKTNFEKPRITVTTYKPAFQFIKDIFSSEDENTLTNVESMEIPKATTKPDKEDATQANQEVTERVSPGELDLGTGSPDPTIDNLYNTPTEPTTIKNINKIDRFNLMDYLFGINSEAETPAKNETKTTPSIETTTEIMPKIITTESSYIPEEITESVTEETVKEVTSKATDAPKVEQTTKSFMNLNAVSTSMSTEVSHETEICFRGKCIKTSKDIL